MTFESMIESMGCMDDLQCKEFIVRTKSGKEYIGTPYDAKQFSEYENCKELYRGDLPLFGDDEVLFIDVESIESIQLVKKQPEEQHEEE